MNFNRYKDYKLCYVKYGYAYFTTQDIDKQWGDDWDDAPYEHNAGEPYETDHEGKSFWKIVRVAVVYNGFAIKTPDAGYDNSPYSVRDINAGAVAWLYIDHNDHKIGIPAGTSLPDFIDTIRKCGLIEDIAIPLDMLDKEKEEDVYVY